MLRDWRVAFVLYLGGKGRTKWSIVRLFRFSSFLSLHFLLPPTSLYSNLHSFPPFPPSLFHGLSSFPFSLCFSHIQIIRPCFCLSDVFCPMNELWVFLFKFDLGRFYVVSGVKNIWRTKAIMNMTICLR